MNASPWRVMRILGSLGYQIPVTPAGLRDDYDTSHPMVESDSKSTLNNSAFHPVNRKALKMSIWVIPPLNGLLPLLPTAHSGHSNSSRKKTKTWRKSG